MQRLASLLTIFSCTLFSISSLGFSDWSSDRKIPKDGISNPYQLSSPLFRKAQQRGINHAAYYPVLSTVMLFPYQPVKHVLEDRSENPLKNFILQLFNALTPFKDFDDFQNWVGLSEFSSFVDVGNPLPVQDLSFPEHRLGMGFRNGPLGQSFTLGCLSCHSTQLFGKTVVGLNARFPRPNELFDKALKATPLVGPKSFAWASEATSQEVEMYIRLRERLGYIGAKKPVQLGLDTSLAQVALSLAKRDADPWASMSRPRQQPEPLKWQIADSKPAVWWNVKYKNRWLSDGSIVSGNPILTNLLWNEIGRGADLKEFEAWVQSSSEVIEDLTTAVFSTKPPLWTEFFDPGHLDELKAKRGEQHFNKSCARCHGSYQKNWSLKAAQKKPKTWRLQTAHVIYPEHTPVIDVGTDPLRYQGMSSLEKLNQLEFSKTHQIHVVAQKGYVPPPLVGIWARFPYFHNNSAPSLCSVLTRAELRPKTYWARIPKDPDTDFDQACNGYPEAPARKTPQELYYDTRKRGLSNTGHDEGIFLKQGQEIFSSTEKSELIEYLKTL